MSDLHLQKIESSQKASKPTASQMIPPVALPFVSDKAKKMIDLVLTSLSTLPLILTSLTGREMG